MNLLRDSLAVGQQAYEAARRRSADFARTRAGSAMAAGDESGAAGALYTDGLIDEGAAIEDRGVEAEQRQYERGRQVEADEEGDALRRGEALIKVAQGLKALPTPEARHQALQRIAPVFEDIGIDPAMFLSLTPDQLTDENLDLFSGEVASKIKLFNTSGGVVAIDESALAKDINDPTASRVVYEDPLTAAYKEAQTDAARARAESSRASAGAARAREHRTMNPVRKKPAASAGGSFATLDAIAAELARRKGKR